MNKSSTSRGTSIANMLPHALLSDFVCGVQRRIFSVIFSTGQIVIYLINEEMNKEDQKKKKKKLGLRNPEKHGFI